MHINVNIKVVNTKVLMVKRVKLPLLFVHLFSK